MGFNLFAISPMLTVLINVPLRLNWNCAVDDVKINLRQTVYPNGIGSLSVKNVLCLL